MEKTVKLQSTDLGILLIRVATGVLLLLHGIAKLQHGHGFVREMLAEKGLPQILWLGVPLGECLAPVLLILGVCTRFSGMFVALVMLAALILAHGSSTFTIGETGGLEGELALLFLFSGMALFFTGGGKYVLLRPQNHWLK